MSVGETNKKTAKKRHTPENINKEYREQEQKARLASKSLDNISMDNGVPDHNYE